MFNSLLINKIVNLYIYLLNILYKYTKKIPSYIRNIIIDISCAYLIYYKLASYGNNDPFLYSFKHWLLWFLISFAGLIIASNDRKITKFSANNKLILIKCILLIFIFISFIINKIGFGMDKINGYDGQFVMMFFISIFIFPPFYIIWNNRKDYEYIFDRLAICCSIFCFLYFFNMFKLACDGYELFLTEHFFVGSTYNSNFLGEIGALGSMSSLYLIYRFQNKNIFLILNCFIFSIGLKFILASNTRTALLGLFFCILSFIIFLIINNKKKLLLRIIVILFFSTIVTKLLFNVIVTIYINVTHSNIDNSLILMNKFSDISSGRFDIWKNYIKHINLFGNNNAILLDDFNTTDLSKIYDAHNNILHITFRFGIFSGIIYSVFLFYIGINTIKILFLQKCHKPYHLFVILCVLMFASYACFEVATTIFLKQVPLLFYFSNVIFYDNNEKNDKR